MTRDDIIRMAREAGAMIPHITWLERDLFPVFMRFAERVAAAERENMVKDGWRRCAVNQKTTQFCGMLEDAVKAEREECAAVCDEVEKRKWLTVQNGGKLEKISPRDCAAAIRARGGPK